MKEKKLRNFQKYTTQLTEELKNSLAKNEQFDHVWLKDRTPSRLQELFQGEEIEWHNS